MPIPSYERRSFSEIAVDTTLASGINDTDLSASITSPTGWPTGASGDFYISIDAETIRVDTRSSTTLTFLASGRGANGTTASAHDSGAAVSVVHTAFDDDEANYVVNETVGKVTTAGDLLVSDGANSLDRLAMGTTGLPLVAGASTPSYAALGTSGIADDAITAAKIGTSQVGASEIADGSVGTAELADSSVTSAKITDLTIVAGDIANTTITAAKMVTDPYARANHTGTQLLATISDAGTLAALSAVTTAQITDGTIATVDLADAIITPAKMAATAYTSFTPTVGGTGWANVNGTFACQYIQHGKMVHAHFMWTLGSSSTAGSSALTLTLPVTAVRTGYSGTGYSDHGGGGAAPLISRITATGVIELDAYLANGTYALLAGAAASVPTAWGTGHFVTADITYEAA